MAFGANIAIFLALPPRRVHIHFAHVKRSRSPPLIPAAEQAIKADNRYGNYLQQKLR
jgi:hypothetical protein